MGRVGTDIHIDEDNLAGGRPTELAEMPCRPYSLFVDYILLSQMCRGPAGRSCRASDANEQYTSCSLQGFRISLEAVRQMRPPSRGR